MSIKDMRVNDEQFVVYLFSMFHPELGFEHIVQMQLKFPDCTAVKEGKKVSIEFERTSDNLTEHLDGRYVYKIPGNEIYETDSEIIVKEGSDVRKYPKSDYKISHTPQSAVIMKKVLKLDYCVCWRKNPDIINAFKEVYGEIKKFIELSSKPIIIDFLEKRRRSLQQLGFKDLALM